MRNPLKSLADALASTQEPETTTKSGLATYSPGDVDTVAAPENLAEEYELYETTGIVAAALEQYAGDVVNCGYRVTADSDATADFFNGGDAAPSGTPQGGFLSQAGIIGGQRHQDFQGVLRQEVISHEAAGNIMVENVKDPDTNDITGFLPTHPASIKLVTEDNKPILLSPDEDVDAQYKTPRGEAAAFLQYHEDSVFGRLDGYNYLDRSTVPLSQNDVTFRPRNPSPGEIWGIPVTRSIGSEISEMKEIISDNATAIKSKAYGIWSVAFKTDLVEAGGETILTEWSEKDQTEFINGKIGREMGPGDIIGHDGTVEFQKFEGEVADELLDVINSYIQLIIARLPTPLYAVGFEENINQFVVKRQEERYEKDVADMRRILEETFTPVLRRVAEQRGLNTDGLELSIEPEEDSSPIRSLDSDDIADFETYAKGLQHLFGPKSYKKFDQEKFADLVAQLPEDAFAEETFETEESEPGIPPESEIPGIEQLDLTGSGPDSDSEQEATESA